MLSLLIYYVGTHWKNTIICYEERIVSYMSDTVKSEFTLKTRLIVKGFLFNYSTYRDIDWGHNVLGSYVDI